LLIGSGHSPVLVDDAAEESCSPRRAVERNDAGVLVGRVLVEALVGTVVVEVTLVLAKDATSVALVVDQHSVGALGSNAANESFRVAVRPRHPRWSPDYIHAFGGEHRVKGAGELRVSVADQVKAPG
jgi:hypothetical protein